MLRSDKILPLLTDSVAQWLSEKSETIVANQSAKDLFLTYTLLARKATSVVLDIEEGEDSGLKYFKSHGANELEVARMYLLIYVLDQDFDFFKDKVVKLTQVADITELETFLKYLHFLPQAAYFRDTAVDALRTNIGTVFDAISQDNPYPALHFNDQQWNQMFLKAAFIQSDLNGIRDIEARGNADLARIVSDYAHERWAASRTIDAHIWRPVTHYLEGVLLADMERLFQSEDPVERKAATLCCSNATNTEAKALIGKYPEFSGAVQTNELNWNTLKN